LTQVGKGGKLRVEDSHLPFQIRVSAHSGFGKRNLCQPPVNPVNCLETLRRICSILTLVREPHYLNLKDCIPLALGDRPSVFQGEERRIPAADESFLSSPALIKANGRLHTDTRMQALTDVSFIF
jgi:hypothetical protein